MATILFGEKEMRVLGSGISCLGDTGMGLCIVLPPKLELLTTKDIGQSFYLFNYNL